MKPTIIDRCTFAYGDSSIKPETFSTYDTVISILAALFKDVQANGKLLNRVVSSEEEVLAILLNSYNEVKDMGKNLDYCIETHIHGDKELSGDVESLYMDESFKQTIFTYYIHELCGKYGIKLKWISKIQIDVNAIREIFS